MFHRDSLDSRPTCAHRTKTEKLPKRHNALTCVLHQFEDKRYPTVQFINIDPIHSTATERFDCPPPILTHLLYTSFLARLLFLTLMKITSLSIGALLASFANGFTPQTTAHTKSTSLFPKPRRTNISEMAVAASALNIKEENDAPTLTLTPPRKICLMVEPTPFTHVSGYSNRFNEMLRYMSKAGDNIDILTVDSKTPEADLPKEKFGYRIQHTQGFTFPLYDHISLTFDLPEMKGASILERMKPDLIHASSP